MKVKLLTTLVTAALMTACSSDSSSPESDYRTITVGFDYGLIIDPMATDVAGSASDHLLTDDYYLLINGVDNKEEAIGPFSIDDSYIFEVRDGYHLEVVHGEILEKLEAEVTDEYSVAGNMTVATDIDSYTMTLENRHFTYVTVDSSEKIDNIKVNGEELYDSEEKSYFHAFVNGEIYIIEGVTEMGPFEQELEAVVGQHHKWYIIEGDGGFEIENDWDIVDRPAEPQEPTIPEPDFSYKGLELVALDPETATYTATVNSEAFPQTGLLVPSDVSIAQVKFEAWMKKDDELYGYTNIWLSDGVATKCATIFSDETVKFYDTNSCSAGEAENFNSWAEFTEERDDLAFQKGRHEFGLGLVNIIHRNAQAQEDDVVQVHMSYDVIVEEDCDYHRVDNGTCVGQSVEIKNTQSRTSVGIQIEGFEAGVTTLSELANPQVSLENEQDAFINFYCKAGLQADSISYQLTQDWDTFTKANQDCELVSYQGFDALGSHAVLRSGSTTLNQHQFSLSNFEIVKQ
ncbi:hypothetical protein [Shewanella sp. ENK2]|uniref:hypothetical protein n=1 Tax=Shewanella sp. ENK2 TaxID=2775245 RepID=UPI003748A04B